MNRPWRRKPIEHDSFTGPQTEWSRTKSELRRRGVEISEIHFNAWGRLDPEDRKYLMSNPWRVDPADKRIAEISKRLDMPPNKVLALARIDTLYMH